MNDVFDRLVARATQRSPVLVARRPSRFEPVGVPVAGPALPPATGTGTGLGRPPGLELDGGHRAGDASADELLSPSGASAGDELLSRSGAPVARHGREERRAHDAADELLFRSGSVPDDVGGAGPLRPSAARPRRSRASTAPAESHDSAGRDAEASRHPREPDPTRPAPPAPDAHSVTADGRGPGGRPAAGTPVPRAAHATAATGDAIDRSPSVTALEQDSAGQQRESLPSSASRARETRTLTPERLLADHLGPALVEAGALSDAEAARLVAVPRSERDRPSHDGRMPVALDPVEVPVGAEVHLHIDHLDVRRPAAPQPPGPRAAREPAGSRSVDHTAYLDRQRRRSGTGRP